MQNKCIQKIMHMNETSKMQPTDCLMNLHRPSIKNHLKFTVNFDEMYKQILIFN